VDRVRMRKYISFKDSYAVSEIVAGILLVGVAVTTFSVIFMSSDPNLQSIDEPLDFIGYVDEDGNPVIQHMGGAGIKEYKIDIWDLNHNLLDSSEGYITPDTLWEYGECIYPFKDVGYPPLEDEEDMVDIRVFIEKDERDQQIYHGVFIGNPEIIEIIYCEDPMLISTLRTDTTDEDLICFSDPINTTLNVISYIYQWKVNGNPFYDILMPFDTENNVSSKDYSGKGYHATIKDAGWFDGGVIGGAYSLDGGSDYIEMPLPPCLADVANRDLTLSMWIYSKDVLEDHRVLCEGGTHKNFILVKQFSSEIHFGVCESGNKHVVRTEPINKDTWYHLAATWDYSEKNLVVYLNGVKSVEPGNRSYAQGVQDGFDIGHGTASSRFWWGYVDEFQLFDRVATEEQIYQIYLSQREGFTKTSTIVSEETSVGEIWQCIVTPNDGTVDGTPVASNYIQIFNYSGGD
jgi:hypothetical protein